MTSRPAPVGLRLGSFYRTLPLLAGEHRGFFQQEGLELEILRVESSTQQFRFLRDGEYDLVQTSPDNVANYRYNQGNPLGDRIDVQGFVGMDYGLLLTVVGLPEVRSLEELRGARLAVDAPDSGFAYALYRILLEAGLRRGADYTVVPVGGVATRYRLLVGDDPPFEATLLSGGFETRAARLGFTPLRSIHEVVRPYVGAWAAARRDWLAERADVAARFVTAYRRATRWCFDPANRSACLALLSGLPDTSPDLAAELYRIQLAEEVGNIPEGDIEERGTRNVVELRAEFGGFEQELDVDAIVRDGELFDLTPLREGG